MTKPCAKPFGTSTWFHFSRDTFNSAPTTEIGRALTDVDEDVENWPSPSRSAIFGLRPIRVWRARNRGRAACPRLRPRRVVVLHNRGRSRPRRARDGSTFQKRSHAHRRVFGGRSRTHRRDRAGECRSRHGYQRFNSRMSSVSVAATESESKNTMGSMSTRSTAYISPCPAAQNGSESGLYRSLPSRLSDQSAWVNMISAFRFTQCRYPLPALGRSAHGIPRSMTPSLWLRRFRVCVCASVDGARYPKS